MKRVTTDPDKIHALVDAANEVCESVNMLNLNDEDLTNLRNALYDVIGIDRFETPNPFYDKVGPAIKEVIDAWIMQGNMSYQTARDRLRNEWPTLANVLDELSARIDPK